MLTLIRPSYTYVQSPILTLPNCPPRLCLKFSLMHSPQPYASFSLSTTPILTLTQPETKFNRVLNGAPGAVVGAVLVVCPI